MEEISLGELCTKIVDGTHQTPTYSEEGIPFYSAENVSQKEFDKCKYVSEEEHKKIMRNLSVEYGDILMTRMSSGGLGKCVFVDWDYKVSIYVSLALIKPDKEKVSPRYLYQYINTNQFLKELYARSLLKASPQKINLKDISKIPIRVPNTLSEQNRIAEILSIWDRAIKLKEKLIEQKKKQKKGLMQKLLTGEFRLPGFKEKWIKIKIGKLISEISEKSTVNNQYEVLSVTKNGIVSQNEHFKKQIASENNVGYKVIRKNNLVFSTMNLWMGSLDVLTDFDIGLVSPAYKVFEFYPDYIIPSFAKYFMLSEHMIWLYNVNSEQGASIVRRNLDLKALLNTRVKIPSVHEQYAIGKVLMNADREIKLLEDELKLNKQQKTGLMQLLLTGKVRVKV